MNQELENVHNEHNNVEETTNSLPVENVQENLESVLQVEHGELELTSSEPISEVQKEELVPEPAEEEKKPEVEIPTTETEMSLPITDEIEKEEPAIPITTRENQPVASLADSRETHTTSDTNIDLKEIEEEELPDFSLLPKNELIQVALKTASEKEVDESLRIFKAIKPYLEQHSQDEEAAALAKFIEEGGEKDNFEFKHDQLHDQFYAVFKDLKTRKEEARQRQEAEKLENLKKKEAILEEIKKLNDAEETESSLKRLKELQSEWKKIKNVPKENLDGLWESYRVLVEIFYDRLSINNELKDLDRSKNLDQKIELISRVSELLTEPSIKKMLIGVKKLQEDWRNIGPVQKEASEDIWQRFKTEVDKVFALIKEKTEEIEAVRHENLKAKTALLEKAKQMADFKTTKIKDWMEKTTQSNDLMEEWKKIGHVPMNVRDQLWNDFRDARNSFFNNKNHYFKTMHAERNANLKAKEALCELAESIVTNTIDWAKQTEQIKKIQEDWKKIGPAPDKINDAIWRRFRTACDSFFEQKAKRYASQKEEQTQNLEAKTELLNKLEVLLESDQENLFNEVKQLQSQWNEIGYVPMGNKDEINKRYNNLLDKLYNKHKQLNKDMREDREKQQFEMLASSPNGVQKLLREEKILQERIKGMRKDIETWDNNLGFFKSGNNKNPMAQQILDKIEIAKKHIAGLEEKLKNLRTMRTELSKTETVVNS